MTANRCSGRMEVMIEQVFPIRGRGDAGEVGRMRLTRRGGGWSGCSPSCWSSAGFLLVASRPGQGRRARPAGAAGHLRGRVRGHALVDRAAGRAGTGPAPGGGRADRGQRPPRWAPGRAGAVDPRPGALGSGRRAPRPSSPGHGSRRPPPPRPPPRPGSPRGPSRVASTRWRWNGVAASGGGLAEGAEVLQLPFEVGGVLEVLVDAGEAHVGDRVQLAEGVEELDADLLALDLALAPGPDRLLDVTGDA